MKLKNKVLSLLGILTVSLTVYAADQKISELTSLPQGSWATGDLFPIVDLSANQTKKTSVGDFDLRYFSLTGTLGVSNGGTGISSTATFPASGIVATVPGSGVVKSNASILSAGNVALGSEVSGQLPLANGGTGLSAAPAAGSFIYSNGTSFLSVGSACTNNQVLTSNGSGVWACANQSGAGGVTLLDTGTGLSGGPVTGAGTISLANTAVSPGSYTRSSITVDAQGRLTAASSGPAISLVSDITGTLGIANGGTGASTASDAINALLPTQTGNSGKFLTTDGSVASWGTVGMGSGSVTLVDTGTGLTGGPITGAGTLALADTAVTPGSYTYSSITVDQQGRITSASSGAAPTGTVTNIGLTAANIFTITGSPVTTAGTIDIALANEAANTVFAGPSTGLPAVPTFRSLVADDIPNINTSQIIGFDTQVRTSRLDQMAGPTASVSMNSQKITSVLNPTLAQDAATKNYVDTKVGAALINPVALQVTGQPQSSYTANTPIVWPTVALEQGTSGAYNTSTGEYTAPYTGWYSIGAYANTDLVGGSNIYIAVNGTTFVPACGNVNASSIWACFGQVYATATDVITVRADTAWTAVGGTVNGLSITFNLNQKAVTSNNANGLRTEFNIYEATCSSGTCTVSSESTTGAMTVTWTATGTYTVDYTGLFSSPPSCTALSDTNAYRSGAAGTNSFTLATTTSGGSAADFSRLSITCIGPR